MSAPDTMMPATLGRPKQYCSSRLMDTRLPAMRKVKEASSIRLTITCTHQAGAYVFSRDQRLTSTCVHGPFTPPAMRPYMVVVDRRTATYYILYTCLQGRGAPYSSTQHIAAQLHAGRRAPRMHAWPRTHLHELAVLALEEVGQREQAHLLDLVREEDAVLHAAVAECMHADGGGRRRIACATWTCEAMASGLPGCMASGCMAPGCIGLVKHRAQVHAGRAGVCQTLRGVASPAPARYPDPAAARRRPKRRTCRRW